MKRSLTCGPIGRFRIKKDQKHTLFVKITDKTRTSYEVAIHLILDHIEEWQEPALYWYEDDDTGEAIFDAAPCSSMPDYSNLAYIAEENLLGDLTGDNETDARDIALCWYEEDIVKCKEEERLDNEY
jgi:hypothetical protein